MGAILLLGFEASPEWNALGDNAARNREVQLKFGGDFLENLRDRRV
jgi:hypothetical protein